MEMRLYNEGLDSGAIQTIAFSQYGALYNSPYQLLYTSLHTAIVWYLY